MTLQRRLLVWLLVAAPLAWGAGLLFDLVRVRHEINELFDSQQVLFAHQVEGLLPALTQARSLNETVPGDPAVGTLAVAAWRHDGERRLAIGDGTELPFRPGAEGFVDLRVHGTRWRIYYLPARVDRLLIAVGHRTHERQELVNSVLAGQIVPWLLLLLLLLAALAVAARRALAPLRELERVVGERAPGALQPLPEVDQPDDLKPLVRAMNALLARVEQGLARERRFTADAAHELRTPLAALQAQWDAELAAMQARGQPATAAQRKIGAGLARLRRLVAQLLALARLDGPATARSFAPIDWPGLVEQLFSELLGDAQARDVELACEWPPAGATPMPATGDADLLRVLLRNLLENAVRHAPPRTTVTLVLAPQRIEVRDAGPGVPAALRARLGERFFRVSGADPSGSGLGLSIARRIAALHGLELRFEDSAAGGFAAVVTQPG